MNPYKFTEHVQIVGPNGTTQITVDISFQFPPTAFSSGMTMFLTRELQDAVQRIIEQARKIK